MRFRLRRWRCALASVVASTSPAESTSRLPVSPSGRYVVGFESGAPASIAKRLLDAGEQVTKQDLGHGTTAILAYDYMLRHQKDFPGGIRVASNRWGFAPDEPYPKKALHAILRKAMAAGIAVVFSAGNYGPAENTVDYPMKAVPEILTMAVSCPAIEGGREISGPDAKACGRGEIADYSSRGSSVDIAAPGAGIWAPKNPSYATQRGVDTTWGWGEINAFEAVKAALTL